jgi:hypothetical protein
MPYKVKHGIYRKSAKSYNIWIEGSYRSTHKSLDAARWRWKELTGEDYVRQRHRP